MTQNLSWICGAQTPVEFWDTSGSPNDDQTFSTTIKENHRIGAVPVNHRLKLKESEKKDKYLNLPRDLTKKLWNMKMMVILILIGAPGTVTKVLIKTLEDLEIRV